MLRSVDAVVGYETYINLIRPIIKAERVISSSMTKEVERVLAAIHIVKKGRACAIVCSGDPGIYAMAGLVFEICKTNNLSVSPALAEPGIKSDPSTIAVEVIPGIPALCAGASLLGAPLTHDFAAVSLSDLLTPWDVIERRLRAAAEADFVIVLYNPRSKRRSWQLEKAQKTVLEYRDKRTPVGLVTNAMRKEQKVEIVPLESLHKAEVGMRTTVFIGSSTSFRYLDYMVTSRGYSNKYSLELS
ncbi:MAG: precorrin-3B C(17)-methyltransferase [Deltaproteobacteria bacterium]|nr:precorrin-3B C(17)-methyltransferase [Deltaproteobacteria bacterium]